MLEEHSLKLAIITLCHGSNFLLPLVSSPRMFSRHSIIPISHLASMASIRFTDVWGREIERYVFLSMTIIAISHLFGIVSRFDRYCEGRCASRKSSKSTLAIRRHEGRTILSHPWSFDHRFGDWFPGDLFFLVCCIGCPQQATVERNISFGTYASESGREVLVYMRSRLANS
jgi:hypothetical protein